MGHPGLLLKPKPTPKLDLSKLDMSGSAAPTKRGYALGSAREPYRTTVTKSQLRIPGYTGHIPSFNDLGFGRSFGYMEMQDNALKSFRADPVGTSFFQQFAGAASGSSTARGGSFTRAEQEILKAKFKDRRPYDAGRKTLQKAGLIATPRGVKTLSFQEAEATWIKSPERTARDQLRCVSPDRPSSPEGRHPADCGPDPARVVAEDWVRRLDLPEGALDPCIDKSWGASDPDVGWSIGCDYEVPKGWVGIGLRVPAWAEAKKCFRNWQTVYYPLQPEYVETALRNGQALPAGWDRPWGWDDSDTCLQVPPLSVRVRADTGSYLKVVMPGDKLADGSIAKVVHLNQKDLIEKRDPNTAFPDRCATRVYTTPSIRYARMKVGALTRDAGYAMHLGKRLVFVLMCRQRSVPIAKGGYHMCGETIGFGEKRPKGERISQYFSNGQIEYYTLNRASVIPYRLLVSVESDDQPVSWSAVKWRREGQPGLGAMSIPGLALPFTSFETPRAALQVRDGGLESSRPRVPFVSFPETRVRRDVTHPRLSVSTQPHEPEALVSPSKGWKEGTFPPGIKDRERLKTRSLKGVLQEMKEAFLINGSSLGVVFDRLRELTGSDDMRRQDLARLLLRLNIVRSLDEHIIDEVWHYLDEDESGSVSIEEFTDRFGILGKGGEILDMFRRKVAGQFNRITQAFRDIDADRSGSIDKHELKQMLGKFGLLDQISREQYDELWNYLDRDGSGHLSFDEFTKKFAGGAGEVVVAYGVKGPASGNRKTSKKPGTIAHEAARICDEGTAYYAQMDFEKAESCYRKALQLDPNHVASLCSLAWMLRQESP